MYTASGQSFKVTTTQVWARLVFTLWWE
jgi:hypothetical protein